VIAKTGKFSNVIVVQLEEGALLGDDVGNFLGLAPMLNPVLKVLNPVVVKTVFATL
jgi:hypothetical protein